ncbi:hypothetical protein MTR_7g407060 [Medicago truncatula]|uniref:Uncharacterized protein n=1 Tax=Medicago truncatula TaxID=3880 RepID=A0A072TWE1_MEDTR|nr:hypothetical protein MTR_7g407060 [Medicago truncatula]
MDLCNPLTFSIPSFSMALPHKQLEIVSSISSLTTKKSRALYLYQECSCVSKEQLSDALLYCQHIKSLFDQLSNDGSLVSNEWVKRKETWFSTEKHLGKQAKDTSWPSHKRKAHEVRCRGALDIKECCLMHKDTWFHAWGARDGASIANFAVFRPLFYRSSVLKCLGT